jgi:preprotein translocase subunit SecG
VFGVLIVLHVIICIGLMIAVLMQSAKGEGLAGAFGGGGGLSGAVFGGRGAATFLSRATTVLAVLFMLSCILLTFISRGRTQSSAVTDSAVQEAVEAQQQQAPPVSPSQAQPTTPPAEGQQPTSGQEGQAPAGGDIFDETPPATEPPPGGDEPPAGE